MKIWIARDNAIVPEDMEHYIEKHPEEEIRYAKLSIFYDMPTWDGKNWNYSRKICEIDSYMLPEIGCGECFEFNSTEPQ